MAVQGANGRHGRKIARSIRRRFRRARVSSTSRPKIVSANDAVEAATGVRPALPPRLAALMTAPERVTRVPNDIEAIKGVIGREAVR